MFNRIAIFTLGLGLCTLLGCSQVEQSLVKTQQQNIPVVITRTPDIYVDIAQAQIVSNQLQLDGVVRRDRLGVANVHGHVTVTLVDDQHTVLKHVKLPITHGTLIPEGLRRSAFTHAIPVEQTAQQPAQVLLEVCLDSDCNLSTKGS